MYTFIELPIFSRFAAYYFIDAELADIQIALAKTPTLGDVVPGTYGVRILYDLQDVQGRIWLLSVYAKSARENIATSTLNALRKIADPADIN